MRHHLGFSLFDGGAIVEQGPPEQMLSEPRHDRTRQFLRRVLPS